MKPFIGEIITIINKSDPYDFIQVGIVGVTDDSFLVELSGETRRFPSVDWASRGMQAWRHVENIGGDVLRTCGKAVLAWNASDPAAVMMVASHLMRGGGIAFGVANYYINLGGMRTTGAVSTPVYEFVIRQPSTPPSTMTTYSLLDEMRTRHNAGDKIHRVYPAKPLAYWREKIVDSREHVVQNI